LALVFSISSSNLLGSRSLSGRSFLLLLGTIAFLLSFSGLQLQQSGDLGSVLAYLVSGLTPVWLFELRFKAVPASAVTMWTYEKALKVWIGWGGEHAPHTALVFALPFPRLALL
jgi:uncharacterized PurR-regulated membrane protein YhhQ (DUF165 family)